MGAAMKSLLVRRSIILASHRTSICLEDAFWSALKEIAIARGTTLSDLVSSIDAEREHNNLSSAVRLYVLGFYRSRLNKVGGEVSPVPVRRSRNLRRRVR